MKKLVRRGLLFLAFLLALLLLVGVTTVLADPGYHVVRAGETLFSIGRLYGVNPYVIAQVNGLPNPNYIRIGQVLYIPGSGGWVPPPPRPRYYPPNYWGYYRTGYYYPSCWWNWCWWDP